MLQPLRFTSLKPKTSWFFHSHNSRPSERTGISPALSQGCLLDNADKLNGRPEQTNDEQVKLDSSIWTQIYPHLECTYILSRRRVCQAKIFFPRWLCILAWRSLPSNTYRRTAASFPWFSNLSFHSHLGRHTL